MSQVTHNSFEHQDAHKRLRRWNEVENKRKSDEFNFWSLWRCGSSDNTVLWLFRKHVTKDLENISAWCKRTRIYIYMEFMLSPNRQSKKKKTGIFYSFLSIIQNNSISCTMQSILISINSERQRAGERMCKSIRCQVLDIPKQKRKYSEENIRLPLIRHVAVCGICKRFSDPCTYLHHQYVDCSICGTSLRFVNVTQSLHFENLSVNTYNVGCVVDPTDFSVTKRND